MIHHLFESIWGKGHDKRLLYLDSGGAYTAVVRQCMGSSVATVLHHNNRRARRCIAYCVNSYPLARTSRMSIDTSSWKR